VAVSDSRGRVGRAWPRWAHAPCVKTGDAQGQESRDTDVDSDLDVERQPRR
jgi:hypothetical protein